MSYFGPPPTFSQRPISRPLTAGRSLRDAALAKHIHAALYPFDSQPVDNCFPVQRPSRKEKIFCRGTFGTGSDQFGYVFVSPTCASNPTTQIMYSAGAIATSYDSATNPTYITTTNAPYGSTSYGSSNLSSRFLSIGLRVRKITGMLARGGSCFGLKAPADTQLSGVGFNALISSRDVTGDQYRASTNGDEWQNVVWTPTDDDQMEFRASSSPFAIDGVGTTISHNLGFVAVAPGTGATNQQFYEFEYVAHYEILGTSSVGGSLHGLTLGNAHPDTPTVQQVLHAVSKKPVVLNTPPSTKVAPFIADCVAAGHDITTIANGVCDLATRTASIVPSIYKATRQLGSFL